MAKRKHLAGDPVSLAELQAGPVWSVPRDTTGARAHRFKLVGGILNTRCSLTLRMRRHYEPGLLLHAGDFPHCQRCEEYASRR